MKKLIQEAYRRVVIQQSISKGQHRIPSERLIGVIYFECLVGKNKTFKIVKQ